MATVLERLNFALLDSMGKNKNVILLGEDILDPYGGAFKVTKGCSSKFPERVFTTPISEAAITGIANGLALAGKIPVVEIMFGDFVTLIADQLINHASKFRWMYNDQVRVPIVVRTPMGGRRGYGPTHSQSLEKLFLGVPGLITLAPNAYHDPAILLQTAILKEKDPVLFIEHKLLYTTSLLGADAGELIDFEITDHLGNYPSATFKFKGVEEHQATIATYGYNFELARKAALQLAYEQELFCEIVLVTQLSPFQIDAVSDSVTRTRKLITIEEGSGTMGWGAEIASQTASQIPAFRLVRIAALDLPIGNSRTLEEQILPSLDEILQRVRTFLVQ
jgi:pyruvate/2-oxoglutarate/acetoin dehydrogenase E1 component